MKVLSGSTSHNGRQFNLVGLPKKIAWAAVLLMNHTATPSKGLLPISFSCHVAGVGAGIAYSYVVLPGEFTKQETISRTGMHNIPYEHSAQLLGLWPALPGEKHFLPQRRKIGGGAA